MKTISIENGTASKDSMFKVFVNGEKHVVSRLTNKIQVDDEKSFNIRAKYFWDSSPKYTFEPKDNMTLQIFVNRITIKRQNILHLAGMFFLFVHLIFFGSGVSSFFNYLLLLLCFLCFAAILLIRKTSFFVIQEVSKSENMA